MSHQDSRLAELESQLLRDPLNTAARLEYARLLLAAQDKAAALEQYDVARKMGGTPELPEFEALRAPPPPPPAREPVKLSVVQGARSADVVSIARPVQVPDKTRFMHIAGMEDLKKSIRLQIIEPFLNPGMFAKFRKKAGGGILLYGPPGCGKTMLARAVANECNASFLAIGISEILTAWLGESERNLALMFEKARSQKPCVMFFDELDALAFARSKSSSDTSRKIVNEFLSQLDGFENANDQVLILAATNMPWDVDPAMKRPGRFARQVFVPPPDAVARARIIELALESVPHGAVDTVAIAKMTGTVFRGGCRCAGRASQGIRVVRVRGDPARARDLTRGFAARRRRAHPNHAGLAADRAQPGQVCGRGRLLSRPRALPQVKQAPLGVVCNNAAPQNPGVS